jgi:hypothetical protein
MNGKMQKIEQLSPGELLRELQPAEMETRFLGANYRGATNLYLLSFEVDEATWLQFKASVPKGAILQHRFFWTNGDEQPRPKKQKEPTPYGKFWERMFQLGFYNSPDLWEVLNVHSLDAEAARQLLHNVFETESLSVVSPEQWETWLEEHHLHSLITMSRNALAATQAKAS